MKIYEYEVKFLNKLNEQLGFIFRKSYIFFKKIVKHRAGWLSNDSKFKHRVKMLLNDLNSFTSNKKTFEHF